MTVSAEEFRQGMRRLGGAVHIVTGEHNGIFAGLTATAVTSLSAEPPRLLACINRAGATYDIISKGRSLAVNVLGSKHKDLAILFAGLSGHPETERFSTVKWDFGISGAPMLPDALVSFDCEVESILDAGSHGIVIGLIRKIVTNNSKDDVPLCYLDGDWATMISMSEGASQP